MCECFLCECCFLYLCRCHGCAGHACCCGVSCCAPETNRIPSVLECCCLKAYCCNTSLGIGAFVLFLGGWMCCAPELVFQEEMPAPVIVEVSQDPMLAMTPMAVDPYTVREVEALDRY
jgi:hypothetical protein